MARIAALRRFGCGSGCSRNPATVPSPARIGGTIRVATKAPSSHSRIRHPVQPCRGRFPKPANVSCREAESQRKMSETSSVYTAYQGNSYLFGGNAPYVEEMYENYLANPGSVPDNWRDVLRRAAERAGRRRQQRQGCAAPAGHQRVRRARQAGRHQAWCGASGADSETGPQAHRGAAAHRRLPQRRRPLGRPRPAQARRAREHPRAGPVLLRLQRCRPGNGVQHQQHLLRQGHACRCASCINALRETYCGAIGAEYMYISDQNKKRWWQQKLESIRSKPNFSRREEEAHPRPRDGRRRPGALPAHQVRRPEALLARRRRELHRLDGRADPGGRRQGRAGDRDRHGPPRPPERAGQFAGQDAGRPVRRVRPHAPRKTCPPATSSTTRASAPT